MYIDKKGIIIIIIAVIIGCVICVLFVGQTHVNTADMPNPELDMKIYDSGEMSIYIDPATQLQYLVVQNENGIAITPRLSQSASGVIKGREGLNEC